MPQRKEIEPEFIQKIEELIRQGLVAFPPVGDAHQANVQKIWYPVTAHASRTSVAYQKRMKRTSESETRGFFRGAEIRAWHEHFQDYERRLQDYAKSRFVEALSSYINSDQGDELNYWPSLEAPDTTLAPRPRPPIENFTPRMAEEFATQVMLYLGATGAKTTDFSNDGGIDCLTDLFVVQVKHLSTKVGVATIRETIAVANLANRQAVVFSRMGFSQGAIILAIQNDVLLYTYHPLFKPETNLSVFGFREGLDDTVVFLEERFRREEILAVRSKSKAST